MVRHAQARSCLGQLLFHTGRWDDAIGEVAVLPEDSRDPGVACCDHGIAAVISFHRGEPGAARQHLADAAPHAQQIGNRVVGTLALARSHDSEQDGALAEALGVLTEFTDSAEELDEIEDLLADGVRLATKVGDAATRAWPSRTAPWPWPMTPISRTGRPTPSTARAWSTMTPAAARRRTTTTMPGGRCSAPRRWRRRPGRSWTPGTATRPGTPSPARLTSMRHWARPGTWPGCRPGSASTASAAARAPSTGRTGTAGSSLTPAEITVAALVEQGLSNPQIADKLFLSRKTVATHVSHILGKLGVRSRIDVAREAAGAAPRPAEPLGAQLAAGLSLRLRGSAS